MVSRPTRLSSRGTDTGRTAATNFIQRYQLGPQKGVYLFLGIINSDVRPLQRLLIITRFSRAE
jgi:hypothetical protein